MNIWDLKVFRANREKTRLEEADQEGWLVSYADLITLLFVFFSLLLSVSVVSRTKFDRMSQEFNQSAPGDIAELQKKLEEQIQKENLKDAIQTEVGDEGFQVQFSEQVLFDSAEAQIRPAGVELLSRFAKLLLGVEKQYRIAVEGHTDDLPIRSNGFESNWSLSSARSVSVLHLLEQSGLDPKRLMIRAYADTRPVNDDKNIGLDEKRRKNRRVTLLVY